MQKNGHRFAPAFTKTGGMMDETPGASTAAVGPSTSVSVIEIMDVDEPNVQSSEIAAGIPDSNAIVTTISIDDIAWKFQLTVGDLVDAKDPSGIWYQVRCINSTTRTYFHLNFNVFTGVYYGNQKRSSVRCHARVSVG